MNLGARLKQKRKEKGYSQAELAAACDLDGGQSLIGNYERGIRSPKLDTLKKLSVVLDCSPEWLAYGTITSSTGESRKLPLLKKEDIRWWLNGKRYPRTVRTLLSVSERAFCYKVTDPAADGAIPRGAIALFDPEEVNNLSAYRFALIFYNGEAVVKQITYDSGSLFFTGGLVTIQGSNAEVLAPLISLPEVTISSKEQ